MLPLIPLAISLAPEIGKWLFGTKGEAVAADVAKVVQTVTGTSDATEAAALVAKDPIAAAQLRLQLAQIAATSEQSARAADLDAMKAQLADVAGARSQTVALATAGSSVQWAPAVLSGIVLTTFGVVMWAALTRALPAGSETILNMLMGTIAAMATGVVNYWVGSSAGSRSKDAMLFSSTPSAPQG